ncbi:MAG: hypothetical protein WED09_06090 [Homoserinimonas sp.]
MRLILARLRSNAANLYALTRDNPAQLWRMARALVLGHQKYRGYFLRPEHWRQGESEVRKRLVRNLMRNRGLRLQPVWKKNAIDVLVQRSQGSMSHAAATDKLNALTEKLDTKADVTESYLAFAKACASIGLFEGSYGFVRLASSRIESDFESSSDLRVGMNAVRVAIHQQRADTARARWGRLKDAKVPPGSRDGFDMLGIYMSVWNKALVNPSQSHLSPEVRDWNADIANKRILILGPTLANIDELRADEYDFIAQIFRNRDLIQIPNRETGASREILYVGGLYFELKQLRREDLIARFGRLRHFVINAASSELGLPNTRRADSRLSSLFLRGTPNMIQVMCLDLLTAGAASLYVTGANFYASSEPYAAGEQDGFEKFGFCCAIASHNPSENRAIIANLVDAGVVSGDETFLSVLGLSDLEYLKLLDQYYGVPER